MGITELVIRSEKRWVMEDLKSVLSRHGFNFKKQFGQNFLTDTNLLRAIVADAGIDEHTTVLEIGPGAGALTRALSERAKQVIAYEIDKTLQPVLADTLQGRDNVEVVFRDFAKVNLAELEAGLESYAVVANLPYYVTTPIVMRLVEEAKKCRSVTVMVQEEVADRFCASEGTEAYGAITAAIARKGVAKITRRVSRSLFTPRPNVDSAVVHIDFSGEGIKVLSERAFRDTVRCAFLNRRKTLENNLMQTFALKREQAGELLRSLGVDERARGETLSPTRLARLSDMLVLGGYIKEKGNK